jgi:hypothetical protein
MIRVECDGSIVRVLCERSKKVEYDMPISIVNGGYVEMPLITRRVTLSLEQVQEFIRALTFAAELSGKRIEIEHWGEV